MGFFIVSRSGPLEKLRRQEESGTGSGKLKVKRNLHKSRKNGNQHK